MDGKYLTGTLWIKMIAGCLLVSTVFYFAAFHQIHYRTYDQIQNTGDGNTGGITDEKVIEQYFRYDGDYIQTIGIMAGTYARKNTGILNITLKNARNEVLIWKGQIDIEQLEDNKPMVLPVQKKLDSGESSYCMEIRSDGCSEDNSVTLYCAMGSSVHQGMLRVNGESTEAELEMGIYGDKINYHGKFYWFYVLILIVAFTIFFYWQRRKEETQREGFLHNICNTLSTYRFMIKQLVSRDFKTKYKRSVLGMFWSFLNPLLTMVVQYVVFSTIFRGDIENYPVYLLSASILFTFFTESVGGGLLAIVGNASLIKKVYVPKYIYPVTKVLSTSVNLVISLVPLLAVILITGERINRAYLLIPYILICLIVFSTGMALILSSLMVFFRDVQFLWGIVSLLWMYATPMFYPESIIPDRFRFVLDFNPMYHYISFFRNIILNYSSPQMSEYVYCTAFSVIICAVGALIFSRTQKKFVLYL